MPKDMGYKPEYIRAISNTLNVLAEAVESLEDGEAKTELMQLTEKLMEKTASLEAAEVSPEDEMMESDEGLDLGEAQPFQPEKARVQSKSPFGAMTEEI